MKAMKDLAPNECLYAVGDRDNSVIGKHWFCGEVKEAKSPYCKKHHEKCNPAHVPRIGYNNRGKRSVT